MMRRLSGSAILTLLGLVSFSACSSESKGGPPSAPCDPKTKGTAPVCGKTCSNMCGCADCQPGAQEFIDGTLYVCSGGCFAVSGGTGGASSGGAGGGAGAGGGGGAGGDPCAGVSCTANPPMCGACTTCACCTCNNGQTATINAQLHICNNGCYQLFGSDGGA